MFFKASEPEDVKDHVRCVAKIAKVFRPGAHECVGGKRMRDMDKTVPHFKHSKPMSQAPRIIKWPYMTLKVKFVVLIWLLILDTLGICFQKRLSAQAWDFVLWVQAEMLEAQKDLKSPGFKKNAEALPWSTHAALSTLNLRHLQRQAVQPGCYKTWANRKKGHGSCQLQARNLLLSRQIDSMGVQAQHSLQRPRQCNRADPLSLPLHNHALSELAHEPKHDTPHQHRMGQGPTTSSGKGEGPALALGSAWHEESVTVLCQHPFAVGNPC